MLAATSLERVRLASQQLSGAVESIQVQLLTARFQLRGETRKNFLLVLSENLLSPNLVVHTHRDDVPLHNEITENNNNKCSK